MQAQPSEETDTGMSWSVVTTGPYMDMMFNVSDPIAHNAVFVLHTLLQLMFGPLHRRADGTHVFAAPVGSGRVPMIALSDLGFFARYTFDNRSITSGRELPVASQMVTMENIVSSFRRVTGQKAVVVDKSIDAWFDLFEGVDNPLANEKGSSGDGSITWKENFKGWWALWRDDMVKRDMDWVKSINPNGHTVESWMREVDYDGQLRRSVLKNAEDSKTISPIHELLAQL